MQQILQQVASDAWCPPPDITVSEWAVLNRVLSSESSSEAGKWSNDRAPYQVGMMDAVNDPMTHTIVAMTSAQVGKTELINNIVGYYIDHDPSPMLCLQPTLEMADTWSKDRLAPMVRDTPVLRGKVQDTKSKTSGNTIRHKVFAGGHITMAGANSPASLASRPIRIVLCDEVDRYPVSAGTEGDPVSLARKRTKTFWNRKIILTSTPTIKHHSRIEKEFNLSDKRYYYVPCPECNHMQTLKWSNIVIPEDDHGEKEPSKTFYVCDNGCIISPNKKHIMLKGGEWRATAKFNGRAGFHLNELYSPWSKWSEIATDFLEMSKDVETLKTFVNTSLAETWEEKGESSNLRVEDMMARRESYDSRSLPDEILFITAAIDVQKDRLEVLTQGWGENKERWNIELRIIWGDPVRQDVWRELDDFLLQGYTVRGSEMKIACTAVDSGYLRDMVYNFVKPRQGRRVFAIKGSSEYYGAIASKPRQVGNQRVSLYLVGVDSAKDLILMNYLHADGSSGRIHFPADVDDEFFSQLLSEERKTKWVRGQPQFFWSKLRERNEVLDLHVYNEACYAILKPNVNKLLEKAVKVVDNGDNPEQEEQPLDTLKRRPTAPVRKRKSNWVSRR